MIEVRWYYRSLYTIRDREETACRRGGDGRETPALLRPRPALCGGLISLLWRGKYDIMYA